MINNRKFVSEFALIERSINYWFQSIWDGHCGTPSKWIVIDFMNEKWILTQFEWIKMSNQIYSYVSHRQLNENTTKHSFLYIVSVWWMQPPKISFKEISRFPRHTRSNFHGLMILLHICHHYTLFAYNLRFYHHFWVFFSSHRQWIYITNTPTHSQLFDDCWIVKCFSSRCYSVYVSTPSGIWKSSGAILMLQASGFKFSHLSLIRSFVRSFACSI